jgi:hypothetical protein
MSDGPLALAVEDIRQTPPGMIHERLTRACEPWVDYWGQMGDEIFRVLSLRALYDYMMGKMSLQSHQAALNYES